MSINNDSFTNLITSARDTIPLFFAGEYVLTTNQIATVVKLDGATLRRNFCNHKDDFYHYGDYYRLQGSKAAIYSRFIHEHEHIQDAVAIENSQQIRKLILWTQSGCLKLVSLSQRTLKLSFEEISEIVKALYIQSPIPPARILNNDNNITSGINENIAVITNAVTNLFNSTQKKIDSMQKQIDALNNVHPQGDTRQQIWRNVNAFADKAGIEHREAWHIFYNAYNTAYRTNITAKYNNYKNKYQKPENYNKLDYLQDMNGLNDALRIAQKLNSTNTPSGGVM